MRMRIHPFMRALALLVMTLGLTGAVAVASNSSSLQSVELDEEICATLDADSSGDVNEDEAGALVDLGFNIEGDDAVVIDQADFDLAVNSCADVLAGGVSATPEGGTGEFTPNPAHIHSGTCETLGEVVFPLNDVVPVDGPVVEATPAATMSTPAAMMGTPAAGMSGVVADSTTTVDVTLEDLLEAEYAINAHESTANIQNYIACGDITGEPTDGELQIELMELNDSGFMGHAMLTDNGDGSTTVVIMLMQSDAGTSATPAATPAS